MDSDLFEGQTVDVPCPKCGHAKALTIHELKSDGAFVCVGCGTAIQLDGKEFREGLKSVEGEIDNLRDSVRGLGGDLEIE